MGGRAVGCLRGKLGGVIISFVLDKLSRGWCCRARGHVYSWGWGGSMIRFVLACDAGRCRDSKEGRKEGSKEGMEEGRRCGRVLLGRGTKMNHVF